MKDRMLKEDAELILMTSRILDSDVWKNMKLASSNSGWMVLNKPWSWRKRWWVWVNIQNGHAVIRLTMSIIAKLRGDDYSQASSRQKMEGNLNDSEVQKRWSMFSLHSVCHKLE